MPQMVSHRVALPAARLIVACLLSWPAAATALATSTTFSGQATVVKATAPSVAITLGDTGPLPSSGGSQEASLLDASVPGVLTAEVLHGSTVGQGNSSGSEASAANLTLTAPGHTFAADFLMARATASCWPSGASVVGSADVLGLTVDGQTIAVAGQPNQTITLVDGTRIVINEQSGSASGSTGNLDVTALHVIAPGVSDVTISAAHADITCPSPPPTTTPTAAPTNTPTATSTPTAAPTSTPTSNPTSTPTPGGSTACQDGDFVTGGGWIAPNGSHDNFGVAGGMKNGGLWGHLEYHDHGSGGPSAHGTGVTAYTVTGTTSRHIEGTAEINGQGGFTYKVDVADNGAPGVGNDTFALTLSNGYSASGTLGGGNITLHKPCQ